MIDKDPHDYLPWDRCPRCGERVSRKCPDCFAIHGQPDCRQRGYRPHPFPPAVEP
jgi:hypothetical protein